MHSSNRAFEASVQVRGRPVKEVHHRGRTYVEGRKGTEYTLYFKNTTPRRVLVIPSVDGLSVLDGKPAGRNSAGFIVKPYEDIEVPGWIVNDGTAARFTFWPQDARGEATYVEELSKSGARVDTGNQGLIGFLVLDEHFTPTLQFSGGSQVKTNDLDTWQKAGFDMSQYTDPLYQQPRGITCSTGGYSEELHMMGVSTVPLTAMNYAEPAVGIGTKFGEATDFDTKTGEFSRGSVCGEIVLEYDTLRGLKDRGIDTSLFKGSKKGYGSRSAFPGDSSLGCKPPSGWS